LLISSDGLHITKKGIFNSRRKDQVKIIIVKLLGYLLTPLYLCIFGLLLVVFHPIQVICRTIGGYSAHKKSVEIMNFLIIKSLLILGTSISFRCFEKLPRERPIILISNHQSMFDIPPIVWGFRHYHPKFISKIELGRGIPSVSYNLRYGGSVLIDRNNRRQAVQEIANLGRYIEKNNYTASIFPEGTRTKDGKMKPFKSAGINTLLKYAPSAVVVPLVIEGNYELMKKGLYPMSFGVNITYTVLDPFEPASITAEELVMKTENLIRAAMETPAHQL
jgi:1-acyl-sn-glycerol-3-phosphate acyltransferase